VCVSFVWIHRYIVPERMCMCECVCLFCVNTQIHCARAHVHVKCAIAARVYHTKNLGLWMCSMWLVLCGAEQVCSLLRRKATACGTLQHTATHCNTRLAFDCLSYVTEVQSKSAAKNSTACSTPKHTKNTHDFLTIVCVVWYRASLQPRRRPRPRRRKTKARSKQVQIIAYNFWTLCGDRETNARYLTLDICSLWQPF